MNKIKSLFYRFMYHYHFKKSNYFYEQTTWAYRSRYDEISLGIIEKKADYHNEKEDYYLEKYNKKSLEKEKKTQ